MSQRNGPLLTDLRIVKQDNPPIVRSAFPLEVEPYPCKGLERLRTQYKLDRVIAGAKDEFDEILRLRDWVSRQWDHGFCNDGRWETTAEAYLKRAARGECFTCAVYAYTLVEVFTAMGFVARNITMSRPDSDFIGPTEDVGHCVCEVWSNQYRKWITLDADAAAHFEKDGVPLGVLELRREWIRNRAKQVKFVRGPHVPKVNPIGPPGTVPSKEDLERSFREFYAHRTINYYFQPQFWTNNVHHAQLKRPAQSLAWVDDHAPQRIVRHNIAVNSQGIVSTGLESDVNFTVNHAFIRLYCPKASKGKPVPRLDVTLESQTPWFSRYEVRIDGKSWQKRPARFRWNLHDGINRLETRPVNQWGRAGSITSVSVRCEHAKARRRG